MIKQVYVTKYALTEGVTICSVAERPDGDGWITVSWPGGLNGVAYFRLGKEAHVMRSDAEYAFECMREAAIRAAERKLERLRAMKFEVRE